MKKFILSLLMITMLTGCVSASVKQEEVTTTVGTEYSSMTEANTSVTYETAIIFNITENTTIQSDINSSDIEYSYQPPNEVLNTYFYTDDIETEIILKEIDTKGINFFEGNNDQKIYSLYKQELPDEIVEKIIESSVPQEYFEFYNQDDVKVVGLSYMKYDLNKDNKEDYFVRCIFSSENDYMYLQLSRMLGSVEKIFIADGSGYKEIDMPELHSKCAEYQAILSTTSNGFNDIFVFINSNSPVLSYDGKSKYTGAKELDEDHIFLFSEFSSENILHINIRVSGIDVNDSDKYYVAIKFEDNPYFANDLIYSCYPDGMPRKYTEKHSDGSDFSSFSDGYDFYVELTEEGIKAFTDEDEIQYIIDLLEIKYVEVE